MRPGVRNKEEIKRHPFFKDIDWRKLEARVLPPPIHLRTDNEEQTEEEAFLNARPSNKAVNFTDQDYTDDNKNVNRLKKYTFVSGQ